MQYSQKVCSELEILEMEHLEMEYHTVMIETSNNDRQFRLAEMKQRQELLDFWRWKR